MVTLNPSAFMITSPPVHLILALSALALTGCKSTSASLEDDSDDAIEMQTHPRRTEMPSLFDTSSNRLKSGRFPVIKFSGDSWDLERDEAAKVKSVAAYLRGNPERVVIAAGAAALTGEYARLVSDMRAQSVRTALIDDGVPASKIISVSFGDDAPAVTGGGVSFSLIGTGESKAD